MTSHAQNRGTLTYAPVVTARAERNSPVTHSPQHSVQGLLLTRAATRLRSGSRPGLLGRQPAGNVAAHLLCDTDGLNAIAHLMALSTCAADAFHGNVVTLKGSAPQMSMVVPLMSKPGTTMLVTPTLSPSRVRAPKLPTSLVLLWSLMQLLSSIA